MTVIIRLLFVWIITEVFRTASAQTFQSFRTNPANLPTRNFLCRNGKYISGAWFCDSDYNCDDWSDESVGCNKSKCGAGKFDCGFDEPCIEINAVCNTTQECPKGADELNCGDETNFDHCSLHEGRYLCKDGLKCLDFSHACDGVCNCFDCSDETDRCKELDSRSCISCGVNCLPTPNGPQCVCNSSQYEGSKFCRENFNSSEGQTCIRHKNSIRCKCNKNYHEIRQSDGITCRNNVWLEQMLFYSTASKIKMLNDISNGIPKIIQNDVNCTILTAAKTYLYYAAYRDKKTRIFKTPINGGKSEKIVELDSTIKSLAVDWISNNVYFTSNDSLLVCSNDGQICTLLKCCGIDNVVLAPKFGLMFYVRNEIGDNEQLIMKSNMDGSEEKTFVDTTFYSSTSLAIDEWAETLYCLELEHERTLYSFSLNGSKKNVHQFQFYSDSESQPLTQFSVLERYIYFIKKNDNKIRSESVPQFNYFGTHRDKETNKIRNLFAFNPLIQFTYVTENPCATSSCGGLCLLRAGSGKNDLNYTCTCENFVPSDNNLWCGDHLSRSVMRFKSPQTDLSTEPSPTFILKNHASTSTRPSIVHSSAPVFLSSEHYLAIGTGYFNIIMSCMTFALGILMLYLLNGINHSITNRQTISSGELIEM